MDDYHAPSKKGYRILAPQSCMGSKLVYFLLRRRGAKLAISTLHSYTSCNMLNLYRARYSIIIQVSILALGLGAGRCAYTIVMLRAI